MEAKAERWKQVIGKKQKWYWEEENLKETNNNLRTLREVIVWNQNQMLKIRNIIEQKELQIKKSEQRGTWVE